MILRIYEYFHKHKAIRWTALVCITALLAALVMRLTYQEDISAFLPLDKKDREALNIYQDISGANRLFVIFQRASESQLNAEENGETEGIASAIDDFCAAVARRDTAGWTADMTAQVDMERVAEMQSFVYENIPYFLTQEDYRRMDSLIAAPDYLNRQLAADREMLNFPSGGLLQTNLSRDPLNLFTPVLARLQDGSMQSQFEIDDGYIFTPDMSRAIVMISSPFGNAETENNAKLVELLDSAIDDMHAQHHDVEAHVVGGPQIAVGNAKQIKTDSIIAVILSGVLILSLLFYSIRSLKNILLIALSIGWGMLFALGGMALLHDSVSIIVIGISSVILGIAVNYPLHLVAHTRHEPDMRRSLRDISAPLLIGNITTVGAFLALVPLESTALRDLGLFASLLLVGTIIFVLVFLPHHVKTQREQKQIRLLTRIANVRLEQHRWIVVAVALLTAVFAWFSLDTEFDSNMANINYMTDQQRDDMDYFQRLMVADSAKTTETLYVVSSADNIDAALDKSLAIQPTIDSITQNKKAADPTSFLCSQKEQERRLDRWRQFVSEHRLMLTAGLASAAAEHGFSAEAFADFNDIVSARYSPQKFEYFDPLTKTVFAGNISIDREARRYSIVDKLQVDQRDIDRLKSCFPHAFDVKSMNAALADTLSDDFNYIGWACSAIVFFFLWFSFGRIELAILSFLPMAVSWIWILGIMTLLGIKFNIVNIILATFIFGQGDDYTIFMTEGCQYEYAHRRPLIASYKNSIVLSALIMFIGIGTLIVAKHPALFSLAEITIVGMFSVVLMAWLLPPLIFNWLTRHSDGSYRLRPITLASLMKWTKKRQTETDDICKDASPEYLRQIVLDRYLYKGKEIQRSVARSLRKDGIIEDILKIKADETGEMHFEHCGYGERALLAALIHPSATIVASDADADKLNVLRVSANGLVSNVRILMEPPMESTERQWTGTTYGNGWMHKWLIRMLRVMDTRVIYAFVAIFVVPVCLLVNPAQKIIYRYFRERWGMSPLKAAMKTYRNFYLFGQVVVDRFAMYAGKTFNIDVEGDDSLHVRENNPEGFMMFSAHIGNYEMAGYSLTVKNKKLHALVFAGEKDSVMENRNRMFAHTNIGMIAIRHDMSHIFDINNALADGDVVSMPADRMIGSKKCIRLPFLGKDACFPAGPFSMATMRGVDVMAVNVMKVAWNGYKVFITPINYDRTLTRTEQIDQLARAYVSELERIVTLYPEQWYNYYEFWS